MSFQERNSTVSLFTTIVTSIVYYLVVARYFGARMADPTPDLRFWGAFLLGFIPTAVLFNIVVQIVYIVLEVAITRRDETELSDELGRLVDLKAVRNFSYTFLLGFFLTMLGLIFGMAANTMFLCFYLSMVTAGCLLEISTIWYYRRGTSLV